MKEMWVILSRDRKEVVGIFYDEESADNMLRDNEGEGWIKKKVDDELPAENI